MKLLNALVLLLLCTAVLGQDATPESAASCDCSAQVSAVDKARAEIKDKLKSLESSCSESAQKAKLEQQEKLKELEEKLTATCAAETKAKSQEAQSLLSAAQQKQQEAESKLGTVQQKLLQTESTLSAAQQKLESTEASLAKLAAASSARGADVEKLASELAATKSKLAELEAAWIPVRVQKHITEGIEWSKKQYEQAASSEQGKKVLTAVEDGKVWVANALKPLEPHLKQVQPKLAQAKEVAEKAFKDVKAQAETFYEKQLKSAPVWQNLQAQWAKLNKELTTAITTQLRTAPAPLNAWADPVIVQYIVYSVVLLPFAFVLYFLSSLLFGKSRQPDSLPSGRKKGGNSVFNLDGDSVAFPTKPLKRRK